MLDGILPGAVRIVAPSFSLATVPASVRARGMARLAAFGLRVQLGAHVDEMGSRRTAPAERRIADLHAAFEDPDVGVVMAAQGGSTSNQLLPRIDYARLLRSNKVLVGFSDISALLLALGRQTGVAAVHGPNFVDLCNPILPDYTVKGLLACLSGRRVEYQPPLAVSDEVWHNQDARAEPHRRFDGWTVLRGGRASGEIVGGNLVTVSILAGTPHVPETRGRIFFLEDAFGDGPGVLHRELVHFAQLGAFDEPAAFIFGIVPGSSPLVSPPALRALLDDVLPARATYPVVAGVSCSHVSPMMSIPLFRPAELDLGGTPCLVVNAHVAGEPVRVTGRDALVQSGADAEEADE